MRRFVVAAASSLVFFLSACGAAKAGDKCDTQGYLCADATTALECKLGAWVALPCKGANGCKKASDSIKCDMTGNVAGDACASSAVGKGLCTADQKAVLECREDSATGALTLKKTMDCRTCAVTGDQVTCQP